MSKISIHHLDFLGQFRGKGNNIDLNLYNAMLNGSWKIFPWWPLRLFQLKNRHLMQHRQRDDCVSSGGHLHSFIFHILFWTVIYLVSRCSLPFVFLCVVCLPSLCRLGVAIPVHRLFLHWCLPSSHTSISPACQLLFLTLIHFSRRC